MEVWLDWDLKELNQAERGSYSRAKYILKEKEIEAHDCDYIERIPKEILKLWIERFN